MPRLGKHQIDGALRKRLAELAASPGCADLLHINVWTEKDGAVNRSPGEEVQIPFRGADGRTRKFGASARKAKAGAGER